GYTTSVISLAPPCWPASPVSVPTRRSSDLSVGVKLNVDDVPEADWPVLDVTVHAYVSGVSASAPSVTVLPRLTGVPSTTLAGAPVVLAVVASAVTVWALLSVPSWQSFSFTG